MTIEERDTARAIQCIAKVLKGNNGTAPIDWEQRKWELAKSLYLIWCETSGKMFLSEAAAVRKWAVEQASLFLEIYKEIDNNDKTEK